MLICKLTGVVAVVFGQSKLSRLFNQQRNKKSSSTAGEGKLHVYTRLFGPAREAIHKYTHNKLIQEKLFQMCNYMPRGWVSVFPGHDQGH